MAHSFDKTYLASLGFADADRKTPEHDKACQYLAIPEVSANLVRSVFPLYPNVSEQSSVRGRPRFEVALTKGSNQYKVTLGFIDLILTCRIVSSDGCHSSGMLCVEVKITKIAVSEIIRQINFYRQYKIDEIYDGIWIAALRFDITEQEAAMFASEQIRVVRLGAKFDEFLSRDNAGTIAKIEEV